MYFINPKFNVPLLVQNLVDAGAVLAVSISGGKDSQALLYEVKRWYDAHSLTNPIVAIHADLGLIEWAESAEMCRRMCAEVGVELVVVRSKHKGGLMEAWRDRMNRLKGKNTPHWSSPKARYCTSDLKMRPIDKHLRKYDKVVSICGMRAEESRNRANLPTCAPRKAIITKNRKAVDWLPIHTYTTAEVYEACGQNLLSLEVARKIYQQTGTVPPEWNMHPAYAKGNTRVSCSLCIMQSEGDAINGIRNNPKAAELISQMEQESGFSFIQSRSITELMQSPKINEPLPSQPVPPNWQSIVLTVPVVAQLPLF